MCVSHWAEKSSQAIVGQLFVSHHQLINRARHSTAVGDLYTGKQVNTRPLAGLQCDITLVDRCLLD